LDSYIDDCAAVAEDWGREGEDGYTRPEISPPTFPSYPTDLDWHSIEYKLMYDLLSLPTAADKVVGIIDNAFEYADPPDLQSGFETRSFQYATLGLKAFDLTARIRRKYRMQDRDRTEWDPVEHMKKQLQDIKGAQEKRSAAWAGMCPPSPSPAL
jgi:hypothetical protein